MSARKHHTESNELETPVMPHVYDGIQEYDHRLPNWWLWTLYLSIIFFVLFWFGKMIFGIIPTDVATLNQKLQEIEEKKNTLLAQMMETMSNEKFWEMSQDETLVARGAATYQSNCAACHGQDLTAKVGSNQLPGLPLVDEEWKYGGKPMEIFKLIREGSPDVTKGMVAWEPSLGAVKVAELVAFILSQQSEENRLNMQKQ